MIAGIGKEPGVSTNAMDAANPVDRVLSARTLSHDRPLITPVSACVFLPELVDSISRSVELVPRLLRWNESRA